ncbi:hypothetical protein ruthe_00674 [Rubellimicrobium thermophilum DSM 16684]|uniref:Uncharacterized protein n=1 Tax=Rubellimicrobium thermophilum DSM 16684 TaxID=1123069 RepID=S9R0U8_9RHOB|nr:hypothetical protein ruthe_00674 [Rubellimicrobium thermophilum DSM 16684]
MEPHPGPQRAEIACKIHNMGAMAALLGMPQVNPVGRGVLADHQKFAHASRNETLGLPQDGMGRTADQPAAQVGNDAEPTLVIAALRNLQIAVMARGQPHGLGRQQVDEGVGTRRHGRMNGVQHLFVLMGPRHGQNPGMRSGDVVRLGPEAAGDDHPAVALKRLADGLETLGLGTVEKAAGVDDHRIGAGIIR